MNELEPILPGVVVVLLLVIDPTVLVVLRSGDVVAVFLPVLSLLLPLVPVLLLPVLAVSNFIHLKLKSL